MECRTSNAECRTSKVECITDQHSHQSIIQDTIDPLQIQHSTFDIRHSTVQHSFQSLQIDFREYFRTKTNSKFEIRHSKFYCCPIPWPPPSVLFVSSSTADLRWRAAFTCVLPKR